MGLIKLGSRGVSSIKLELIDLSFIVEIRRRHKCKLKWTKDGDKDSKLFHKFMSYWKRKNTIVGLLSRQRHNLVDDNNIEAKFLGFYRGLYSKQQGNRTLPTIGNWDPITTESPSNGSPIH